MFDAIAAGNKMLNDHNSSSEVEPKIDETEKKSYCPFRIRTGQDSEGLICEALLTGNLEAAVELCMNAGKTTEALILAMNGTNMLFHDRCLFLMYMFGVSRWI